MHQCLIAESVGNVGKIRFSIDAALDKEKISSVTVMGKVPVFVQLKRKGSSHEKSDSGVHVYCADNRSDGNRRLQ